MQETTWDIKAPDGARIYGVKSSPEESVNSAIFMVHGLTSNLDDYVLKVGADFFAQQYDVYRFNLCDWQEGARNLKDCTLQDHADDLRRVVESFAKGYEKVFLIGHSYGGLVIMYANLPEITAASLWEPAYDASDWIDPSQVCTFEGEEYNILMGQETALFNKEHSKQLALLDVQACIKLASNFNTPLQVVHGAEGILIDMERSYHNDCQVHNRYDVIPNAGHCFTDGSTADVLLEKTHAWFDKFK